MAEFTLKPVGQCLIAQQELHSTHPCDKDVHKQHITCNKQECMKAANNCGKNLQNLLLLPGYSHSSFCRGKLSFDYSLFRTSHQSWEGGLHALPPCQLSSIPILISEFLLHAGICLISQSTECYACIQCYFFHTHMPWKPSKGRQASLYFKSNGVHLLLATGFQHKHQYLQFWPKGAIDILSAKQQARW